MKNRQKRSDRNVTGDAIAMDLPQLGQHLVRRLRKITRVLEDAEVERNGSPADDEAKDQAESEAAPARPRGPQRPRFGRADINNGKKKLDCFASAVGNQHRD